MHKQKHATILFILSINSLLIFILLVSLNSTQAIAYPALPATENVPIDSGGGSWQLGNDDLPNDQRAVIETMLQQNVQRLGLADLSAVQGGTAVSLTFPLQPVNTFTDFDFYAIANFIDQDSSTSIIDYSCGNNTYNGHRGIDYTLWPFGWNKMDAQEIQVVAAAAGTIIGKQDGNQDRSCTVDNAPPWNAIYVQHADGSVAWYGHLKENSLTSKNIGQTVAAGEFLAFVGSSGMSTGPHLHFELWQNNSYTQLLDPYAGSCNALNSNSWWQDQRPYYDSTINKMTTGNAPVEFQACSLPDIPNEQSSFQPGDPIYFTAYYRDQQNSQQSQYTITRPDNSIYQQWTQQSDTDYRASYWWQSYTLPQNAPEGTWKFSIAYEGTTYEKPFTVTIPALITVTNPSSGAQWLPSETQTITWQSTYSNNVKIDLYKGLTYSSTLTNSTTNDGQFVWTLPLSPTLAPDYQIRVSDVISPTLFGESAFFAIGEMEKIYLPAVIKE